MHNYPLTGVTISLRDAVPAVKDPVYNGAEWQVNRHEFALQADGVGSFYARDGKEIVYSTIPGADPSWVNLYLNGQVLVALLHQRRILNFHASSFIYNDRGVMIMGETGAGKSSVTASFVIEGAGFLSDDLTPVIFKEQAPYILPLYRPVKLSDNTVSQLNISSDRLTRAEAGTGKQYFSTERAGVKDFPLNDIFIIEVSEKKTPEFYTPEPAEKFSLLRSEICSWDLLIGMPEAEALYLEQLLDLVHRVNIVKIVRPAKIEVPLLHVAILDYLEMNGQG